MNNFFAAVSHRWPAGRRDYHWHILPPRHAADALVEPYLPLTGGVGLARVRPEWIHVTVLHSAPVVDLDRAVLERIVDRARAECAHIPVFDLTLDRPDLGPVAVECPGRPGGPARRLWQLLADITTAETDGQYTTRPEVYYPHASIAYATADGIDSRSMAVWLSDCDAQPVTFRVDRVSLVAQSHDGQHITWSPVLDVNLAPASVDEPSAESR
ncbi:2'-5' RNA ligase family protein [Micromonospora sp. CPCC 206061]|uniref:2'-5' RNA ligase family protein n=1 Tax=Micromonospora sp. CPCC 206061 TaxID=3122410 RepID=UPI002FF2D359